MIPDGRVGTLAGDGDKIIAALDELLTRQPVDELGSSATGRFLAHPAP
jgi:hypothetical protein